jgi:hypothetical protein
MPNMATASGRSILFVLPVWGNGGIARGLANMEPLLRKNGFYTSIVVLQRTPEIFGEQDRSGLDITAFDTQCRATMLFKLARFLRARTPDLIFASGADAMLALAASRLTGIKCKIVILHQTAAVNIVRPPLAALKRAIYRLLLGNADGFAAGSCGAALVT